MMRDERIGKKAPEGSAKEAKKYDLEERTARFGEDVIGLAKGLKKNSVTRPLISQVVRSATSIGANYVEADGGRTKKDFEYKMSVCAGEARETRHWLRMLAAADEGRKAACRKLWREAQELASIFASIGRSCKKPSNQAGRAP